MKPKPLNDRILIQPLEESVLEKRRKSPIIIPDVAKEKPLEGLVVALGTGEKLENGSVKPFSVEVGDIVLYTKYGGAEIEFEETKYLLVREHDILAILGKTVPATGVEAHRSSDYGLSPEDAVNLAEETIDSANN
jgi:chaperonin GroES